MIFQLTVGAANHVGGFRPLGEHENSMHSLPAIVCHSDNGRITNSRDFGEYGLDILWEDVQTVRSHNHLLLATSNRKPSAFVDTADIAGVEPSAFESLGRFGIWIEIPGRHVVAADENFTVVRNLHLNPSDGFANAAFSRVKRMV